MTEEEKEGLPHGMLPAESFDEFFNLNEDRIREMMNERDDYELLYAIWFGGYDYGLRTMSGFSRSLYGDLLGTKHDANES